MIDGSGQPVHSNGTATTADFSGQEVTFVRQDQQRICKALNLRNLGPGVLRVSFNKGNSFFNLLLNEVLFERWHFSSFHVQADVGTAAYQAIGTEV